MDKTALISKINEVLANEFEIEVSNIQADGNIKKTLELDSLSLVDMVALIEEKFGVKIQVSDLSKLNTFNELYDYIAQNMP